MCLRHSKRKNGENSYLMSDTPSTFVDFSDQGNRAVALTGVPDAVIHLASAGVSPSVASRHELEAVNVLHSVLLLRQYVQAGTRHIIVAGTSAEYGKQLDHHCPVPAEAPLEPVSDYAISKARAFVELVRGVQRSGTGLTYLRIFNAYGEGQNPRALWPALKEAASRGESLSLTSGNQVRDFIPVSEVARMFANALGAPPDPGWVTVANCGGGQGTSVRDFATYWWALWGGVGELRFGHLAERAWDPACVVADLGQPWVFDASGAKLGIPDYR